MSFFRRTRRRFQAWMNGRNGPDQLSFVTLTISLLLQLTGAAVGSSLFLFFSILLYAWTIFRIFSKKSYKCEAENTRFLSGWNKIKTSVRQFMLRLKQSRQYKYFKCPQCKTLLRARRGEGNKDIRCPKCHDQFRIKV